MHADLQRLLAKESMSDVTAVPLADLRQLRVDCSAAEGDVSFVRRMTQGRLDIVGHESRRRSGAADVELETSGLLFDMPEILADGPTRSSGRPTLIQEPGTVAQALVGQLDGLAAPSELGDLARVDDDRLTELLDALRTFEIDLSATRRRLHERIDSIQGEIARRYRDGEASIDSLLN